jgi:hypothetical protein
MANAMYLAGFDVKRLHMTDLILGRETLEIFSLLALWEDSLTPMCGLCQRMGRSIQI